MSRHYLAQITKARNAELVNSRHSVSQRSGPRRNYGCNRNRNLSASPPPPLSSSLPPPRPGLTLTHDQRSNWTVTQPLPPAPLIAAVPVASQTCYDVGDCAPFEAWNVLATGFDPSNISFRRISKKRQGPNWTLNLPMLRSNLESPTNEDDLGRKLRKRCNVQCSFGWW